MNRVREFESIGAIANGLTAEAATRRAATHERHARICFDAGEHEAAIDEANSARRMTALAFELREKSK